MYGFGGARFNVIKSCDGIVLANDKRTRGIRLPHPNLQPAHAKLTRRDVRIRIHFALIVERAEPVAQRLRAQNGRRRRAGRKGAQIALADGEFTRQLVASEDDGDLPLQIDAHRRRSAALGDDAPRALELRVGRYGRIQERLQRLGRRDELQVERDRIAHSKRLNNGNEQLD